MGYAVARYSRKVRAGALAVLAFAAGAVAVPAQAQNVPGVTYKPNSAVLSVPVIATVGGSCGFQPGAVPSGNYTIPAPIDTTGWTQQFPFALECTGPFKVAVLSTNGGLKTGAATSPGYVDLAAYDVAVHVVSNAGSTDGACGAADLKSSSAAACVLRGTASPTTGMAVASPSYHLTGSYVQASGGPPYTNGILVAGTYQDTLTVTVSPAS